MLAVIDADFAHRNGQEVVALAGNALSEAPLAAVASHLHGEFQRLCDDHVQSSKPLTVEACSTTNYYQRT